VLAEDSSEELAIAALRGGAWDYLRGPVSAEDVLASVSRWMSTHRPSFAPPAQDLNRIIGISQPAAQLREAVAKVANAESNVLITGETGTGKELVADLIHSEGARRRKPFVCINCAAIPDLLLESELFGHDRGAFTGAINTRDGKMIQANGGTLFFDEVGEMPLYSQAKILRAIESRMVQRIGGRTDIPINVRIIAATNQDLEQLSSHNLFRKDLFFRLNVLRVHLPALRERREDIPPLVDHFLRLFGQTSSRGGKIVSKEAMRAMQNYSWPGNIRELKNVVEALFVTCSAKQIEVADLPAPLLSYPRVADSQSSLNKDTLIEVLTGAGWNISKVAQKLKWSRMTVYRKMNLYGIEQPRRSECKAAEESALLI